MSTCCCLKSKTCITCNDDFMFLFCEKNSDETKKLRFKGNELQQRFGERVGILRVECLIQFVTRHDEINEIDLSYNSVGNEGLRTICSMLYRKNHLEHLNLNHCDITEDGIKTFYYTALQESIILKTLRLCGNKIGPQGGHLVALSIPYIPSLEYLDVGDSDQTAISIDCICLQVYQSKIKILNVSRMLPSTNLLHANNTFLAESLSELFRLNKSLTELHFQKCELEAHDIETLIMGLEKNTTLRFLDLGYNNICCVGAEFLAEWLKTRPQITALNIAGNRIKNYGARALSFGLPFSKLRFLDISENLIENEGMLAILMSIKKPYLLRFFHIWGNKFTHPTNQVLERMMKSKVFQQENIDVKLYKVDGVLYAARYLIDHYKHRYYGVMDHGCAVELKIKRNRIEGADDKPRALINFQHIDRYPSLEK